MTDEEPKLPEAYSDPTKYKLLEGGAIYGTEEGHIVAHLPGRQKYSITKENAHELQRRGKDIATMAHLRGLSKAMNVELTDDAELEEIVQGAGSAVEALTAYMAKTFLSSKNLRGMAESFGRLVSPLTGESERGPSVVVNNNSVSLGDSKSVAAIERVWRAVMRVQSGDALEGVARDVPTEGE